MRVSLLLAGLMALGFSGCRPDPPPVVEGGSTTGATTPAAAATATAIPLRPAVVPADAPCQPDRYPDFAPAAYRAPSHVIVFVDRSSTATVNGTNGPYWQAVLDEISGPMLANGSAMDFYRIHSNTISMSQHAQASVRAQTPEVAPGAGALATKQACDAANVAFVTGVVAVKQVAESYMLDTTTSVPTTANQSDVWGALEVVSKVAASDAADTDLRVLLLTDAMHCTAARCLENTPPASKAQAEAWGREDAARARQQLSIDEAVVARGTYRFTPGDFFLKPGFPNVKYYWTSFLREFGVPEEKVTFNM